MAVLPAAAPLRWSASVAQAEVRLRLLLLNLLHWLGVLHEQQAADQALEQVTPQRDHLGTATHAVKSFTQLNRHRRDVVGQLPALPESFGGGCGHGLLRYDIAVDVGRDRPRRQECERRRHRKR